MLESLDLLDSPQLALPNDKDGPSLLPEVRDAGAIPAPISLDLGRPKGDSGLGEPSVPAAVAVPEAAVNEDDLSQAGKYQVGPTRQFRVVKAVAITHAVNEAPNDHFGDRILASDAAHERAALFRGACVDQCGYPTRKIYGALER